MDDKGRKRVLKAGKLVFHSGYSSINCDIRELSESGAKVQVAAATVLPHNLDLIFLSDGVLYPAEVMWRRGDDLGLAFIGEPRRLLTGGKAPRAYALPRASARPGVEVSVRNPA